MTRVSPEFGDEVQAVWTVSADVSFQTDKFPKYKLGPNNEILEEIKEDSKGPPLKEVVVQETNQLTEQHKRLSVRDLASKFDKNLAAAAKLSEEAKLKEVASLDGHVLLKKLRDALECLKGRLAGRNKDDVEKAISMVEALAVKLTQKEGELIHEKFEVKKLLNFLKQASEDAKKLVNQEKSFACAEIESARAVVQRIGEALKEQEKNLSSGKQQELEELIEVVQEARRIKLMHQPRKVMDMEHELRDLRLQIREKCTISLKLQNELAMSLKAEENISRLYELSGAEMLGSILRIQSCSDEATDLGKCSIQWYRLSSQCSRREPILGANKCVYAPEPIDVGRVLQADIALNGLKVTLTNGPIEQGLDLGSYLETLLRKSNDDFSVVISQMNGRNYSSHSVHLFHIGKTKIKLSRGWITKARESYSNKSMQLCGFRGGGNSAAKSLFWQSRKGHSFVLVFYSERERNGALVLARKYALDCSNPRREKEERRRKTMASRHVVQQHNGGEPVPGVNKQKILGAEKKNRRALGDIGNLVTVREVDGKPLPQVSRPVTRSFCAQLLANAQNAAAENNKKSMAINVNRVVLLDGALPEKKDVARKKSAIKPKPEEIIEISPDTVEKFAELEKENPVGKSSKKKAPTLTSILTARSKAACGLSNNKPKEKIVDIDAEDVNNDLAVVEYVEDMYNFYKSAENEGRAYDYIGLQPEINDKMRAILIDWLVQVHGKFDLSPETLYLTINIVDRYLASKAASRRELQLVGLGAMLIASKYEEIWAPEVNELGCISDGTYSNNQILVMEKQILGQLEWNLTVPTPYVFLVRFIKASLTDSNVENMVYFLAELGMMNYATLMYCPSMIAASAVYAARCTLNKAAPFWNETLKLHTGFSEQQLMDCAKLLVSFHSVAADQKLRAIYRKYSSSERGAVALLPPAKSLLVFTLSNYYSL